ncbi:E2 ubiquitin-conjugating enzyme [Trifolium repens]|nr:E2 ubiquitin-conjugating enzyme [Trifolium repens]
MKVQNSCGNHGNLARQKLSICIFLLQNCRGNHSKAEATITPLVPFCFRIVVEIMARIESCMTKKLKYCERYAKKENICNNGTGDDEESDDEDISEAETQSSDDEIPGRADL